MPVDSVTENVELGVEDPVRKTEGDTVRVTVEDSTEQRVGVKVKLTVLVTLVEYVSEEEELAV